MQQQQQLFAAATASALATDDNNNDNSNNNFRQEFSSSTVSNTATNPGLSTTQQHVMRETQRQRTVRPGPTRQPYVKQSREESFLLSPQGTPIMISPNPQRFGTSEVARRQQQQQDCIAARLEFANGPTAVMMRRALSSDGLPIGQSDFELYSSPDTDGGYPSNTFMSFQDTVGTAPMGVAASPQGWVSEDETSSTRRPRRVSNGIMDRVARFETLAVDGMGRPTTPSHQNETSKSAVHISLRAL